MTSLAQLQDYLRRVQLRVRLFVASRGVAIIAGTALLLTVFFVWLANQYRFAQGIVTPLRILLFLALAVAAAFALALPLLALNRKRVVKLAEQRIPDFKQRLVTMVEKPEESNPFTDLLAEDTLRVANAHPLDEISRSRSVIALFSSGAIAAAILLWLIAGGPGYWGYGASLLWTGSANNAKRPLYDVAVEPGNKTIRRNTGQMVVAHVQGFSARHVNLYARYGKNDKWEATAMQPQPNGPGYQFLFAALSDQVQYYVQAEAAKSQTFTLAVKDLPGVRHVRVALHYPAGLGLRDEVVDPGGDIHAVEGTQADVSIETDRPLQHGSLVLDNGSKIDLTSQQGNWVTARLPISKDGSYHVAALDSGETIRISDDYFIESKKDEAPSVRILKPSSDPKISPIEELPVTVEASDDFGVEGMDLHYSVNGATEQVVPLLKSKGVKEASGNTTIYTETFKLQPGDLISYYATAKDAKQTSRTDIAFAQAEPFDLKFSQSQQSGGGGGGGSSQDSSDISIRQKQIIAATWNEIKAHNKAADLAKEEAKFLAETEAKLGEQAQTLSERMASREMGSANAMFQNFSKLMTDASAQMTAATGMLKPEKWQDALVPEQKALQSLLRAEALFRDIQVAFGNQSGGGGGGGGAQRDLARMFDLELDTSKNQYESAQNQSSSSSSPDQQKDLDKALQRLQELARRQEELAQHPPSQQQAMEQRWQEEQLRREAEELRKQMEQMAQNSQSQQQQSSSSQQSSQSGGQQSQSQSGQQSASSGKSQSAASMSQAMKQASKALDQAEGEMRKAVSQQDPAAQKRAAQQLAQAEQMLQKSMEQQAGQSLDDMAARAKQMADAQRGIANQMKQMYGEEGSAQQFRQRSLESLSDPNGMPEMTDPTNPRGNYYRRRFSMPTAPSHEPTSQEQALANQKENLARQLQQLTQQMQQQQQNLQGTQNGAATEMRKALSDAEQKELALRMQKEAEWMRQGYGERNLDMEDKVTAGMDQLSRDLRNAQKALSQGQQDAKSNEKQEQMLAQIQNMREMLERAREGQQQSGQQSGQQGQQGQRSGQQGQPSQQGGQQQGGQQSGQQGGQQSGQQGGQQSARGGQWADTGGPGMSRQGVNDAISQLQYLRGQLGPQDRGLRSNIDDSLGRLRDLNADPNLLQSAIANDAVASLERLELELQRRMADPQLNHGARLSPAESSSDKYRDAVAEYFKKLSQAKPQ
jgi:hypothetical protein